jgi:hypothetical protein
VLHLAGVLRAAVDQPLALLQRQHIGDLAFQVEVLLPADLELPLITCAARGQRGGRRRRGAPCTGGST